MKRSMSCWQGAGTYLVSTGVVVEFKGQRTSQMGNAREGRARAIPFFLNSLFFCLFTIGVVFLYRERQSMPLTIQLARYIKPHRISL